MTESTKCVLNGPIILLFNHHLIELNLVLNNIVDSRDLSKMCVLSAAQEGHQDTQYTEQHEQDCMR